MGVVTVVVLVIAVDLHMLDVVTMEVLVWVVVLLMLDAVPGTARRFGFASRTALT